MKQIKPFTGKWRIAEMEVWDQDYVDMEEQGYIRIGSDGTGQVQFGLVSGISTAAWNNAAVRHALNSPGRDRMKMIGDRRVIYRLKREQHVVEIIAILPRGDAYK